MTDTWPKWLTVMENGSVGEARTRAFLIDRFWVLERSVDTDGADFLIQRRTTEQRFTDKVPPRVGVIQAKYFQDRRTTHYIPKSYVVDQLGAPLKGFFAILHVGRDDEGEMYILSAQQIVATLTISSAHQPEKFIVGTSALRDEFRVKSRKLALDEIEHSLKSQTYLQTAAFYDQLNIPYRRVDKQDIDFHWTLPLPRPGCDIPETIAEYKKGLTKLVFEMDEVLQAVDEILTERDPRRATVLAENLSAYVNGNNRITFDAPKLWGDFSNALDVYDGWVKSLKADGLFEPYLLMGERLRAELTAHTAGQEPTEVGAFVQVTLEYDPLTFLVIGITVGSGVSAKKAYEIKMYGKICLTETLQSWMMRKVKRMDYMIDSLWHSVMSYVIEKRYPDIP